MIIFPFFSTQTRYKVIVLWCKVTIHALRKICGIHYRVLGFNNLPKGPAIIVSKHQSTWETIAFPAIFHHRLCFVLKKSLLYIPFFGWTLAMTKMIYIDRKKKHQAINSIIEQGKKKLNDGEWIMLFPEGTRTSVGEIGKYKSSSFHLAKATGTQIIPIAHNAGTCWPKHGFTKKPGIITISIGKPINPEHISTSELNQITKRWIENEMRQINPTAYIKENVLDKKDC